MQVKLFYKTSTPETSEDELKPLAEELRQFGADVEIIDADTAEGAAQQELYDITQVPSVVITGPDGSLVSEWKGRIPPAGDIRYWLGSS
jgi:hypothetical protein